METSFFKPFMVKILLLVLPLGLLWGCKKAGGPPPDMVLIGAGEFIMGSDKVDKEAKALQYGSRKVWFANERPTRKVKLPEFYIDRTEVTNRQYKEFVDATGRKPPANWVSGTYPERLANHPVVFVSWYDADEYCKWKGKRLPAEAQWEKAARGTDGRDYPWGNDFDISKVNTLGEHGGSVEVGSFPEGKSPWGALDMAGNANEWTSDWYRQYPGNDFDDGDYGEKFKVVRGGGWGGMGHYTLSVYVSSSFRNIGPPQGAFDDVGFRCVWPE